MTAASVAGSVDVAVGPVDIVLGPKTRLGAALLERLSGSGTDVRAVTRHDGDVAALGTVSAIPVDADQPSLEGALGRRPVRVFVCALGPVQAGDGVEVATVERDLALVERLLGAAGGPVRVVHVSSIIALAPGAGQRYYGGWKCVIEERLRRLVDQHPSAQLSVIYPGRLVGVRNPRRPWQVGYTSYRRLAALTLSTGDGRARDRLVGADARAWLLLRTAALGLASLTGRAGRAADRQTRVSP